MRVNKLKYLSTLKPVNYYIFALNLFLNFRSDPPIPFLYVFSSSRALDLFILALVITSYFLYYNFILVLVITSICYN